MNPLPARVLGRGGLPSVSPAQDALSRQWAACPETCRVYVAGDEDQSIYGFRGSDPALFLTIDAEDRGATGPASRPVSHRCPSRIMAAAETILGHPANVSPCDREGQVHHVCPGTAEGLPGRWRTRSPTHGACGESVIWFSVTRAQEWLSIRKKVLRA